MKTRSVLMSLLVVAVITALNGCGGGKKEAQGEEGHDMAEHASGSAAAKDGGAPRFTVDQQFQQQLSGVFSAYILLKDALVASDASRVKSESASTSAALAKADMKLLSGAAHHDWMNYLKEMEGSLAEMAATDDIEAQRAAFSKLSDNLYESIKAYGLGGATAYYEFCPMAFNNEGAHWLSMEEKIRNPYFGDKMLTCGSVEEVVH